MYSIQIFRAIAAIMVVLIHLGTYEEKLFMNASILNKFVIGIGGVDIFFILSGYIMMTSISKNNVTASTFLKNRFIRIYPIYWIFFLILLLIAILTSIQINSYSNAELIYNFFLLPSKTNPLLNVSWTLVYEVFFYINISILLFLNIRKIEVILILLTIEFCFMYIYYDITGIYFSTLIFEFLFGIVIFIFQKNKKLNIKWTSISSIISIFYLFFLNNNLFYFESFNLLGNGVYDDRVIYFGIPFMFILLGAISLENYINTKNIVIKSLNTIGNASYSLYLIHYFIIVAYYQLMQKIIINDNIYIHILSLILIFLIIILVSIIFNKYIEDELLYSIKKKFK